MAGDGRNTDDVTLPLLFLFHKEGSILLEALKEYREVEVLLSDKARDRGETLSKTWIWNNVNMWGRWYTLHPLLSFLSNYSSFITLSLCVCNCFPFPLLFSSTFLDEQNPYLRGKPSRAPCWMAVSTPPQWVSLHASNPLVFNESCCKDHIY